MNPNFKPEMITPKLLKACAEQVQKYFGQRGMDTDCEFCLCVGKAGDLINCHHCPLGRGEIDDMGCVYDHPTFIPPMDRLKASREKLLARGNRLIEILDKAGISIIDE